MNTSILNRENNFQHPSDGWYNIEAKGEHPNKRAGVVQVIDDAACFAITAAFNSQASAPGYPGMLIDHEHFKHDQDKETVAYGWLTALANRADGIYGQIRWTDTGRKAVDGGDYRFFSTEYDPEDIEVIKPSSAGLGDRVHAIAGPIGRAIGWPCLKGDGSTDLKPGSPCDRARNFLNKI